MVENLLDGDQRTRFRRNLFLNHVEFVFLCQHTPNHRRVLDDKVEGNRAKSAEYADHRLDETKAVQRERFQHTEDVHVHADATKECAYEVDDVRTRDWVEDGEENV